MYSSAIAAKRGNCSSHLLGGLLKTDLLELLDDRHRLRSTVVTSEIPVDHWHEVAGDAGLLVNPLDERDIAAGLSSLLTDADHREHLAAKAKANAGRFSWRKAASETWVVMEEAIEVRRRRLQGSGR